MLGFSISVILDGLIQLGAFLSTCVALRLLLKLIAKNKFETNFFRMITVVGALVVSRVYMMDTDTGWSENIVAVIAVLFVLAFLLILQLLKTPLLAGCIAAMALVPLALFMEHSANRASAKVVPAGPTFAEYMGLEQEAIEENKAPTEPNLTDIAPVAVVRKEPDVSATMTDEDAMESIRADFDRGLELFAERKLWMDSLTLEEKRSYREEMAAFMAEQGIAGNRYSVAAIKEADPTNLVVLASLFSDLQVDEEEREKRVRSIPESVAAIAGNLSGVELSEEDLGMLHKLTDLFGEGEIDEAISRARKELEESQGENKPVAMVLVAMVQVGSGLPVDQLLLGEEGGGMFEEDSLKELASRHWKRTGQSVEELAISWGASDSAAESNLQETSIVEEPKIMAPKDPFLRITTHLGVVMVPSNESEKHEWIAAAQNLRMKGYVSLGDEVVLLRNDGSMLGKGEDWSLEHAGYTYHFLIEKIMGKKVSMRANGREELAP